MARQEVGQAKLIGKYGRRIKNGWSIKNGWRQAPPLRTQTGKLGTAGVPPAARTTLARVMQVFKSTTTVNYINGVKERNWPMFEQRVWQRDYYERIMRNAEELDAVRNYICSNPLGYGD